MDIAEPIHARSNGMTLSLFALSIACMPPIEATAP
jgi:hypothetical protein